MAVAAIVGAIGLGQIYLPYVADRDKLRGLFEEEDMPPQAKHEMDMLMKVEQAASQARSSSGEASNVSTSSGAGSMWKNIRRGGGT
jgi:hypothetical protein